MFYEFLTQIFSMESYKSFDIYFKIFWIFLKSKPFKKSICYLRRFTKLYNNDNWINKVGNRQHTILFFQFNWTDYILILNKNRVYKTI